jgi:hypothetical protein
MFRISLSAMTEPSAVFLVTEITRLVSGGTASAHACGSTTCSVACHQSRPVERAASHWPGGSDGDAAPDAFLG